MLQDLHVYEGFDLPIHVSVENSGNGFYVRAFGGVSATPDAVSTVSASLGIGKSPNVGSRSLAVVSSKSGTGYSSSKAFVSLY
jgi:hypothetical protein